VETPLVGTVSIAFSLLCPTPAYSIWIQHSSHQSLMVETERISKMPCSNSTLTWLITQEGFIIYCKCESFKTYVNKLYLNFIKINLSRVQVL
jgi:hypothetical protein